MDTFPLEKRNTWRWVWPVVVLAILVVAGFVAWRYHAKPQAKLEVTTHDIAPTSVPTLFPADIPLEKGVTILQNDAATTSDGRLQSTRSFITNKSLDDNIKIYKSYLTINKWNILAEKNQPTYKAILASKGTLSVQIVMNEASSTKTVQIAFMAPQSIPPANTSK